MENEEARKGARVGSARSADVLVVVGLDIPSDYGIRAKDPSEDYLCRSWHYRYHIPVTMRLVLCSTCVVIQ